MIDAAEIGLAATVTTAVFGLGYKDPRLCKQMMGIVLLIAVAAWGYYVGHQDSWAAMYTACNTLEMERADKAKTLADPRYLFLGKQERDTPAQRIAVFSTFLAIAGFAFADRRERNLRDDRQTSTGGTKPEQKDGTDPEQH